jgi:hypothetical protein
MYLSIGGGTTIAKRVCRARPCVEQSGSDRKHGKQAAMVSSEARRARTQVRN